MLKYFLLVSISFCLFLPLSWGQEQMDSTLTRVDTLEQAATPKKKKKRFQPKPKRALLLGIIPGGGQIYNRKFWKIPIIYGGLGFTTYMIIDNKKTFNRLNQARIYRLDGDPETVDEFANIYSNQALFEIRAAYEKNVQVAYIWTGVIYTLSIVDAFVDAHLSNFDVSDDLSLQLVPSTLSGQGIGISALVQF